MTIEIPQYGLRAYALLFSKHGAQGEFRQSELDWIVSGSMRKKIFSLLLRSGWIAKKSRRSYACNSPSEVITHLLDFRVPDIMKKAKKPYSFTRSSAVEIWSDFSYIQRSREKSPYFVKVLRKDLKYWKQFLSAEEVPYYIGAGTTIGEYIILIPVTKLSATEKDGYHVDSLKETFMYAKGNDIYDYAVHYIRRKYRRML